ncbi:MAG: chorismate synthase [Bacteroidales bacterium]|jgi:chorismate synthase
MNSFGKNFRVSIFGESHGRKLGVVIDGTPAGLPLNKEDFTADIIRRKGGNKGGTPRVEADLLDIVSGVYNGFTTGSPICITFDNLNTKSADYDNLQNWPRPGHADYVSFIKHKGFADPRGGGHHSGRLTLGLIAAGVIAKKLIAPVNVDARILHIGGQNPWDEILDKAIAEGDSLGGVIECQSTGIPAGLGEPFFNSLESLLSHFVFSIPGVRGIEFGDGFKAAMMFGSEHNDPIVEESGKTSKNGSGGVNGGISNGNDLVFRVAIKPTSSISKGQETYNFNTHKVDELKIEGRHDNCFALRVPVVLEAATAIVIADLLIAK